MAEQTKETTRSSSYDIADKGDSSCDRAEN